MITRDVVIGAGESLSAALNDLDGCAIVGLVMPAAWTAANLTLQMSADDSTFKDVYDALGVEKTIVAGAARYIQINPADLMGANALKIRSGTTGTPVVQAASRTITLILFVP